MDEEQVLALLELLAERGVVAWVTAPDGPDGVALLLEADGFESAVALLVARGAVVAEEALPTRIRLVHPSLGTVELHPASFGADGGATRHLPGGEAVDIPADALVTEIYGSGRARQVRRTGLDPHAT